MHEENDIEELKKIAPSLFSIEKKNVLGVPKDFFEELPSIIQERIIEKKQSWYQTNIFKRLAVGFSFASILLLIGIVVSYNSSTIEAISSNEFAFQELTSSSYFETQTEDEIDFELFAFAETNDFTNFEESDNTESIEDFLLESEFESNFFSEEL